VTIPATTMAFSVMYAFLVYAWEKSSKTKGDAEADPQLNSKSLLSRHSTRPAVS
jgi:hypothetical protein